MDCLAVVAVWIVLWFCLAAAEAGQHWQGKKQRQKLNEQNNERHSDEISLLSKRLATG